MRAFCRCTVGASRDCVRLRRRLGSSSRIGRSCGVPLSWLRRLEGSQEVCRSGYIWSKQLSQGTGGVMGLEGKLVS